MKVLHITHLYPRPHNQMLGIAIYKQIKTLKILGCEQIVISPTPGSPFPIKNISNKWKAYSQMPIYDEFDGIRVYYPRYLVFPKLFLHTSSGIRMYLGIKKLIKDINCEFKFDLIHTHMALPDGYTGMLLANLYKKPLVITFRSTDLDITINLSSKSNSILKKVFSQANKVISPSPRLSEDLKQKFNIESIIISHGFEAKDIFRGESKLYASFKRSRIILSVSNLFRTKGIEFNLYALSHLVKKYDDLIYLIVGDGPEKKFLEKMINELEVRKNVKFIGKVSHELAMEYMSICEIFAMPSYQETFGLVYIEAMAHGKPIIGVQGQGIDGVVVQKETGMLVKPKDVDSLVEAIDYLLSHPEEAKAMGERARQMVLENYTWEKNAEKTIKVYEDVLRKA